MRKRYGAEVILKGLTAEGCAFEAIIFQTSEKANPSLKRDMGHASLCLQINKCLFSE